MYALGGPISDVMKDMKSGLIGLGTPTSASEESSKQGTETWKGQKDQIAQDFTSYLTGLKQSVTVLANVADLTSAKLGHFKQDGDILKTIKEEFDKRNDALDGGDIGDLTNLLDTITQEQLTSQQTKLAINANNNAIDLLLNGDINDLAAGTTTPEAVKEKNNNNS